MIGSKVQSKTHAYPQPEGILGESMLKASKRIGAGSTYGEWDVCSISLFP